MDMTLLCSVKLTNSMRVSIVGHIEISLFVAVLYRVLLKLLAFGFSSVRAPYRAISFFSILTEFKKQNDQKTELPITVL